MDTLITIAAILGCFALFEVGRRRFVKPVSRAEAQAEFEERMRRIDRAE